MAWLLSGIIKPRLPMQKDDGSFLNESSFSSKTSTNAAAGNDSDIAGGTGTRGEGMTRDFLGFRAFSHSDILNISGLGNRMNASSINNGNHASAAA